MRSGCRGFESHSGHLIFSSICPVYIDKHIRVDLSDDEQYVRNMPCYIRLQLLRSAEMYLMHWSNLTVNLLAMNHFVWTLFGPGY